MNRVTTLTAFVWLLYYAAPDGDGNSAEMLGIFPHYHDAQDAAREFAAAVGLLNEVLGRCEICSVPFGELINRRVLQ